MLERGRMKKTWNNPKERKKWLKTLKNKASWSQQMKGLFQKILIVSTVAVCIVLFAVKLKKKKRKKSGTEKGKKKKTTTKKQENPPNKTWWRLKQVHWQNWGRGWGGYWSVQVLGWGEKLNYKKHVFFKICFIFYFKSGGGGGVKIYYSPPGLLY